MGAKLSTLVLEPILGVIAIALLILAELKYDNEKQNKGLVAAAIIVIALSMVLGILVHYK